MDIVVLFFLFVSLLFYLLFGGADFGAGILELFSSKRNRPKTAEITYRVIGPVWEANHIWLIIVIVILWTGFPKVYAQISTSLHIPVLFMLLGIIARGTSFVFRHYDAIEDKSHIWYNKLFMISSFVTPFFIGAIAGALIMGNINPSPSTFYEGYIAPWMNAFSFSLGLLVASISAFLAAVFLIEEANDDHNRIRFISKTKFTSILTLLSGSLVFMSAVVYELPLFDRFFSHPWSLVCLGLATVSIPLFWYYLKAGKYILIRAIAGFQISMILGAWIIAQFPVFVYFSNGELLTVSNTIAPERTIFLLGLALILAGLIILPGLYHLLRVFDLLKFKSKWH